MVQEVGLEPTQCIGIPRVNYTLYTYVEFTA